MLFALLRRLLREGPGGDAGWFRSSVQRPSVLLLLLLVGRRLAAAGQRGCGRCGPARGNYQKSFRG